jgi:hypothetical protein
MRVSGLRQRIGTIVWTVSRLMTLAMGIATMLLKQCISCWGASGPYRSERNCDSGPLCPDMEKFCRRALLPSILLVVGIGLWIAVLWTTLGYGFVGYLSVISQRAWCFGVSDGAMMIGRMECPPGHTRKSEWHTGHSPRRAWSVARRVWLPEVHIDPFVQWLLIPLWIPALLPGLVAGLRTAHRLRRARRFQSQRRCYSCGYDLRGNVSDHCPECGRVTPSPKT